MTINEQLRFFADNGYVVVGGALTAEEAERRRDGRNCPIGTFG